MALFRLEMNVRTRNVPQLYELWQRLQDFSIVFSNIISEWARGNRLKFEAGIGAEGTGVEQPPVVWEALSPGYMKRKRKEGYPDALMVRTGALRQALTNRGNFAEFVDSHRAVFGHPLDGEAADHARYNSKSRPTIFLGRSDRHMIRREVQRYLNFGDDYKTAFFSKAARSYALEQESAQMLISFTEAVS